MIPDEPDVPETQRASGVIHLRYEDVSQDGRVVVTALPQSLGEAVWRPLLSRTPIANALRDAGIVPILSRLHVRGGRGPISVRAPLDVHGCYDLAHTVSSRGEVDRILVRMWARVTGPLGRTHGPPPPGAGTTIDVGAVYAEHVLTRPFGPVAERKVLRMDVVPGMPAVPEHRVSFDPPDTLAGVPPSARSLDDVPTAEDTDRVFGLDDTDSNQHVNSLVYPRVLREAALRRLAREDGGARLLARAFAIAYRKPCFAGDRMRIVGRAFSQPSTAIGVTDETTHGFSAILVRSDDGSDAKPHCYGQLLFGP